MGNDRERKPRVQDLVENIDSAVELLLAFSILQERIPQPLSNNGVEIQTVASEGSKKRITVGHEDLPHNVASVGTLTSRIEGACRILVVGEAEKTADDSDFYEFDVPENINSLVIEFSPKNLDQTFPKALFQDLNTTPDPAVIQEWKNQFGVPEGAANPYFQEARRGLILLKQAVTQLKKYETRFLNRRFKTQREYDFARKLLVWARMVGDELEIYTSRVMSQVKKANDAQQDKEADEMVQAVDIRSINDAHRLQEILEKFIQPE